MSCDSDRRLEFNRMTDYQLLKAIIPDIESRIEESGEAGKELKRRAIDKSTGYRPFHWMKGCM